jgi:hypothetical protein
MKNVSYSDVLSMPTYERRYFLGLLLKTNSERQEQVENMKQDAVNRNAKGNRTTTISGDQLKSQMKSGQLPIK